MNLLLTGAAGVNDRLLTALRQQDWAVDFLQNETDEILTPSIYDAVVCNGLFLHTSIEKFERLKVIQLTSAGLDRIPLDYIKYNDIKLYNARGVYSAPMGEWVVANILSEYKSLSLFTANQKKRKWEKIRSLRELSGKKVAIIGAGNVGSNIARMLKAFNARVYGFDIKAFSNSDFDEIRTIEEFDAKEFDIIILTAPHTTSTHHILNSENMSNLKEGAMIVALSRGGLIDERGLGDVLQSRPDLTAILDVFECEPLSIDSKLWDLGNLRVFPHNSFVGEYNSVRLHELILRNLHEFKENYGATSMGEAGGYA